MNTNKLTISTHTLNRFGAIILSAAFGVSALTGCNADRTPSEIETNSGSTVSEAGSSQDVGASADTIRIGSLKGPTSIGLVKLMEQSEHGASEGSYEFQMEATADVLLTSMINGDIDMALIPANAAAIWYQKFEQDLTVIDINTLGVLYCIAGEDSGIETMEDLEGRTIYLTGKGTTPEYVLQFLLEEHGLTTDDVTLEFCSEATEVLARLQSADEEAAAILPQPYATVAMKQSETLTSVLDLSAEWDSLSEASQAENSDSPIAGSRQVTGVTVVRTSYLKEHEAAINLFLTEHADSVAYVNENPAEASELVAATGIIEKAPIAQQAIPYCNLVCITDEEMENALSGYLSVLYELDPKCIGGTMPGEAFYYVR